MRSVREEIKALKAQIDTLNSEVARLRKEACEGDGTIGVSPNVAAMATGVHAATLRYMLRAGKLPSFVGAKLGGKWVVNLDALKSFLFSERSEQWKTKSPRRNQPKR